MKRRIKPPDKPPVCNANATYDEWKADFDRIALKKGFEPSPIFPIPNTLRRLYNDGRTSAQAWKEL